MYTPLQTKPLLQEELFSRQRLLNQCNRIYTEPHLELAFANRRVAKILCKLGRYDEGLVHYQKALDIYDRIHEETPSQSIAKTLGKARCCNRLGKRRRMH